MLEEQKLPGEREAVMSTRNVSTRSRCADSIAAVKRDERIYMAKLPQLEYCGGTNVQKERIVELLNNYPKVVADCEKVLGETTVITNRIDKGDAHPVMQAPQQLSPPPPPKQMK